MALSLSLPTDNRVGSIVVSNAVCQGLATLFFLARLYSRAYLLRTWRLDDWVLLFAWVSKLSSSLNQSMTDVSLHRLCARVLVSLRTSQFTMVWALMCG